MAKNGKKKQTKPAIGRLGAEAFLAMAHRQAGVHRTGRRDKNRSVSRREAVDEG